MTEAVKCVACGRFLSFEEMESGARFHFEPDNHFGPEVSEWECARCISAEKKTESTRATAAPG